MRQLNSNEKRLIGILAAALLVVVNLFLISFLIKKQTLVRSNLTVLKNDKMDAQTWLADKEFWLKRKEWLDANQPQLAGKGQSDAVVLEGLTASARRQGLTIIEQKLLDPQITSYFHEIEVQLKVTGPLDALARWMVEIQQPTNFQSVNTISIRSDQDPKLVRCELQVGRRFLPGPDSIPTAPNADEQP